MNLIRNDNRFYEDSDENGEPKPAGWQFLQADEGGIEDGESDDGDEDYNANEDEEEEEEDDDDEEEEEEEEDQNSDEEMHGDDGAVSYIRCYIFFIYCQNSDEEMHGDDGAVSYIR